MSPARLLTIVAASLGAGTAGWLLLRDETTDADDTGELVPWPVPVPEDAPSLGARAVEVLSRLLGSHGDGPKGTPGYHRGSVIDKINLGVHGDGKKLLGQPWCARAVRYAYEAAAQELGMPPPFAKVKGTLATVSSWKGSPFGGFTLREPKVGAALLLGTKHATLIAKALDPRTIVSIEGNHGDKVANVKRTIDPAKDTIVDVEAYVASVQGRGPVVAGLDLLGAEVIG